MFWRVAPLLLASMAVAAGFRSDDSPAAIDKDLIHKGLLAWAKQDDKGRSCIGCHSPQGLELAFFDFDDEDIIRRAEAHVSPADAQAIVGMIHARRRQYKIYHPLDSMADRPLQPGGEVLLGDTPADRDQAFAREIDSRLPLLTRGDVDSISKAREASKEVLAIDLKRLKVGFSLNRLSEDGFHGIEHASIADWIPDTPVSLNQEATQARDLYQSDPSDENLHSFLEKIPSDQSTTTVAARLASAKYRALLHLQAQLAHPNEDELAPTNPKDNPYWDISEIARGAGRLPLRQIGLPDDIRLKKEPGPPAYRQFESMRIPWSWIGGMSDPGLQHTSPGARSYLALALFEGGYPMHCAFMVLRNQLSEAFEAKAWTRESPRHYVMEYSSFLANGNFERYAPTQPAASGLYRRFVVNAYRTSLYLLLDETTRSHITDQKEPELAEARQMADYIEAQAPSLKPATELLLLQIHEAFAKAKQVQD